MEEITKEEVALAHLLSIQHGGDYNMFTQYEEVMEHAKERGTMDGLIEYVDDDPDKYLYLLNKIEEMDLDYSSTCPICGEPITTLEDRVFKEIYSDLYEVLERYDCDNFIEFAKKYTE